MAAIVVLLLVLTASNVVAQPVTTDRTPIEGSYPRHHMFFDYLVLSAAMGTIAGVVVGECHGEGFEPSYLAGHAVLGSLLGLFAGASWGGEDGGPSTHPPEPVSTLKEFKHRTHGGDRITVWTREGDVVTGRMKRARSSELELKTNQGERAIPDSAILRITTERDPSWDGALVGAGAGAVSAYTWFQTTTRRDGVSVSRSEMVLIGASILGATGFLSDLFHNGRSVVLDRGDAVGHSFDLVPLLEPGGGGLALKLRF